MGPVGPVNVGVDTDGTIQEVKNINKVTKKVLKLGNYYVSNLVKNFKKSMIVLTLNCVREVNLFTILS